jgi:two-component system, NtrC family, sensor kinase
MKANIIVLDDEVNILNSIKRILKDDFNVFTCDKITSAKEILNTKNIDVVISDYCLQNSSGVDFLSFLKDKYPHITRVIMTGYNVSDIIKEAVNKAGVSNFIKKPWNNEDLKIVIKNALKKSKIIKKNIKLVKDINANKKEIDNLYLCLEELLSFNLKNKIQISDRKDIFLNKFIKKVSFVKDIHELFNLAKKELNSFLKNIDLNILSLNSLKEFNAEGKIDNKENIKFLNKTLNKKCDFYFIKKLQINDLYLFSLIFSKKESEFSKEDICKLKPYISIVSFSIKRVLNFNEIINKLNVWKKVFDAISDPLFILDKNFNFLNVNKESKKTLIKYYDTKYKKCYEVFKNKEFICVDCPMQDVFKNREVKILDYMPCVDNKNIFSYLYPIIKNNEVISLVVYNNNKTSEFKFLKKLIQSEKLAALGALASNIAHEINNPLGGVMAYAQVIKDSVKSKQLLSDLIDIEKACVRCQEIIKNLLDFSSDQTVVKREVTDLNDLINGTVSLLKSCFKNHQISINIPENLKIKCNRGQIQQAFFNIINNAIDAMPDGGNIDINVKKNIDSVEVNIKDEGAGISQNDMKNIFDSFYTTKKKGKGTGLGLFVTNSIIKSHHGSIKAKSRLGIGTNFNIKLPI